MPTYLITGTTRGIGRTLVSSLLLRPNTTLIAGVRDPSAAAAKSLATLPKDPSSTLITVKLDAASTTDAENAVSELKKKGIESLDTVIANAGIYTEFAYIKDSSLSAIREHFEINTLAPLTLFLVTHPLLEKSKEPRFVVTGTAIGSNTIAPNLAGVPGIAYGISKAAVNYLLSKAAGEFPGVNFTSIHPGLVDTDMAVGFLKVATGAEWKPITVEESVKGYLEVLDKPAAETKGKFLDYTGEVLPY